MSNHQSTTDAQTAEREWLKSCRDEVEEAEAHLLAAQAPNTWVDTGPDGTDLDAARATSGYSLEAEVAEELLTPLDAETRDRIANDVLGLYLAESGDEAQALAPTPTVVTAANDSGRRRQWWSLPVTAVAAVLLTLLYVDLRGSAGAPADAFDGTVLLSSTNRAGSQPHDPAETMSVRGGDHLDIHCQAEGREVDIIGVRAKPKGPGEVRTLASTKARIGPHGGVVLKVHADLPPGPWTLFCDAHEPSSGSRRFVGPPATLIVE